jgi:hypothetical protein
LRARRIRVTYWRLPIGDRRVDGHPQQIGCEPTSGSSLAGYIEKAGAHHALEYQIDFKRWEEYRVCLNKAGEGCAVRTRLDDPATGDLKQ